MFKTLDDEGGVISISVEVRRLCGGLSRTVAAVLAGLSSKVGLQLSWESSGSSWLDGVLRFFEGLSIVCEPKLLRMMLKMHFNRSSALDLHISRFVIYYVFVCVVGLCMCRRRNA